MTRRAPLDEYHQKRDFRKTPEPRGRIGPASEPTAPKFLKRNAKPKVRRKENPGRGGRYVVQKHAARRLHFDFRLELDGVLKSWAVTRGPSLNPADKRLAVRTEDHPVEYGDFEGTIPTGEYGGGTVMLWDQGDWRPTADPHEGLERGMLKFELAGKRLRGGFTLVRLKPRAGERSARENWLLIKERDGYADRTQNPVTRWTRSVASGRSLDRIARENASQTGETASGKRPPANKAPQTSAKAAKRPVAKAKTALGRRSKRSEQRPTPAFTAPQLATLQLTPPAGDDWLHEIKFDGYRVMAATGSDGARIYTRSGHDWTSRFRPISESLGMLRTGSAMIDGEVVVFDQRGRSDFSALQRAIKHGDADFVMMAFDLLELDGRDLRKLPQLERKNLLAALLATADTAIVYSDHEIGRGPAVLEQACRMGLEGIISKKVDAAYTSRRSRNWIKSKCTGRDEFVIGGYRPSEAHGRPFSSLLVGEYVGDTLYYRGRVGTGFNERTIDELATRMKPLRRKTSPFANATTSALRDGRWVSPRLVAEIAYTERTRDGLLRHPSFLGLREDKPARDVQTPAAYRNSETHQSGRDDG